MKRSKVVLIHILLWILIYFTFFNIVHALSSFFTQGSIMDSYTNGSLHFETLTIAILLAIPFYFGYFIAPSLFKRKRRKLFITLAALFGTFFPILISLMDDGIQPSAIHQSFFAFAFLNTFLILGIGFRSLFGWIEQRHVLIALEKQNLKSELALLRMQLNPHFLFNTLHNIDTLIFENPKQASNSLIKLSDIMRYMIYKSDEELVHMKNELGYLQDYISLEKLRSKNPEFLTIKITGDYNKMQVAPMLFIPFIENAFKHSVDSDIQDGISINFQFTKDTIKFTCENQCEKVEIEKDETSGIGLTTVSKRLELLYPNRHKLNIEKRDERFTVNLEILIHND